MNGAAFVREVLVFREGPDGADVLGVAGVPGVGNEQLGSRVRGLVHVGGDLDGDGLARTRAEVSRCHGEFGAIERHAREGEGLAPSQVRVVYRDEVSRPVNVERAVGRARLEGEQARLEDLLQRVVQRL